MSRAPGVVGLAVVVCTSVAACPSDDGGEDDGVAATAATSSTGDATVGGSADDADTTEGNDDSPTTGSVGATDTSPTTGPDPDTGTDSDGGSTDTGTGLRCGNGIVEGDEMCDEPNGVDADGCNEDCTESGAIIWDHTQAGGLGLDEDLFGVVVDDAGNAYVTGAFNNTVAGADFWIRQYTNEGGLGWTVSLDGSAAVADGGRDIARIGNDIYAAGFLNNAGVSNDWRIVQYAVGGGAGWSAGYNSAVAGTDVAEAIATDLAGNVFAAGREAIDLEGQNIFVRQYLPGGGAGWSAGFGGGAASDDRAMGIAVDPTGNVIVGGYQTVSGQGRDVWVRKYDPAGAVLWTQGYGGAAALDDQVNGVAADAAGNVLVVGTEGMALPTAVAWVRSYDPDGMPVWTQTWDGASSEGATALDVAIDDAGDIIVVGTEIEAGSADALVRKYDSAGGIRWSETYATDTTANQSARAVAIGAGNRIWIAGGLDRGIDGRDAWVAQLGQ